jgi:hypothetical protein
MVNLKPIELAIQRIEDRSRELDPDQHKSTDYIRALVDARELYDALDDLRKRVGVTRDKLQYEQVPEAFDREGVRTINTKDGLRVTISARVLASTRNMSEGIAWMKENKLSDLVKETINASTLSALARDWMEQGKELPETIFNVHIGQNTSITRVK